MQRRFRFTFHVVPSSSSGRESTVPVEVVALNLYSALDRAERALINDGGTSWDFHLVSVREEGEGD